MKKYIYSIGLNDKDTKEQIIRNADAMYTIEDMVASVFGWGTVWETRGVFMHDDGTIVRENSIRVETLWFNSDCEGFESKYIDFAEWAKDYFNQESVLLEIVEVAEQFI